MLKQKAWDWDRALTSSNFRAGVEETKKEPLVRQEEKQRSGYHRSGEE